MTAFQTEERVCRKSSVYNPTGQTYFQQLSAYNHMNAHLRRVHLASCVVDSRNKRYTRDKGLDCSRFSSRSRSLDKIRTQEDVIDGVAYDTEHHPLDALRMSLECNPECRRKVKRVVEACTHCSDWSARSQGGQMSNTIVQRMAINSEVVGTMCPCLRLHTCKPCSTTALRCGTPKPSRLSESCRRVGAPLVSNRSEWKKNVGDRSRTIKPSPPRSNVREAEPAYCYDSSFESSSETSSVPGSPILKKSDRSRGSRAESPDTVAGLGKQSNKFCGTIERTEEAKYAKFIYDITQEIMINGLYTDYELHAIFKKHIDMNSDTLDRNKMRSEIYQLKMSLNVPERSDDEEDDEIEGFVGSGRFAKCFPKKPPTPPKIFDENKLEEKLQNHEATIRYGESRKPKNSHGKNTVVLVDANPELYITERDVLLTLMEMKLDPRQIQSICKSLQNKSRETALSQTVQVDAEAFYPRRRQDRANSPINSRTGNGAIDLYHPHRDRMSQTAAGGARKTKFCQYCCRETYSNVRYSAEKSQTEVQPEISIQASPNDSQGDKNRMASRSRSLDGISEVSVRKRSIRSSESKKINEVPDIDETGAKDGKISRESLLGSERVSRESSRTLARLGSVESRVNQSGEFGEEQENMAKITTRRSTSATQAGNRSENDSFVKSRESEEKEQERMSKIITRRSTSTVQTGDRDEDDSSPVSKLQTRRESKKKGSLEIIDKTLKASKENVKHDSVRLSEEPDISFVSRSEFLNDLKIDDANSLPDISERSEAATEDIETDEIVTISSQTTAHRSQVEEITDNKLGNLSEDTYRVDVAPINEAEEVQNDELSPTSVQEDSNDSENDEDADENKRVVVAALKPLSSPVLLPKISSSRLNPDVDNEQGNVAKKATLSPELTPRSSSSLENENDKSSERTNVKTTSKSDPSDGDENSPQKTRSDARYSLQVEQTQMTSNSEDKTDHATSIETELDQPETLNSTSEIQSDVQVKEEKARVFSGVKKPKAEDQDEERRESYEVGEQSDRSSMTIDEISKSKEDIFRTDSSNSAINPHDEEIGNSKKQKGKKSICSTRFSRLIEKGNCQRSATMQSGTSEMSEKKLRILEKDKERRRATFLDDLITTASDISFLRKQSLNDSAQLSTQIPLRENESTSKNLKQMPAATSERQDSDQSRKRAFWTRPHSSMYLKKESISENLKQRPEVTSQRQNSNQSGNSITKRLKTAVENLIKRTRSKSTHSEVETTKISSSKVSLMSTTGSRSGGKSSRLSKTAEAKLPSTVIKTRNSSGVRILTSKLVHSSRNNNCRDDCRGGGIVCDERCSIFYRSLR